MKDIISNNKQDILLVIVIVLAAWNIFTTNGIKTDVKSYKNKIESIQKEVDSVQVVNKKIDTKVTIVKNNTNEKVNTVDGFSNVELELFFTNRYNKNSTTK